MDLPDNPAGLAWQAVSDPFASGSSTSQPVSWDEVKWHGEDCWIAQLHPRDALQNVFYGTWRLMPTRLDQGARELVRDGVEGVDLW